ncbi:MAG TPA: pseudouridine synthase [Opitutaceae bacterium]
MTEENEPEGARLVRLQKFIADSGVCSRRAAEALIARGEVWVNSRPARLGDRVDPACDRVTAAGKAVRSSPQAKITLVAHKPRGLVCSNDDPHNPQTVFSLVPREYSRFRFFCAGRLDKDSEGLVILTTDGGLAHRLMHPSSGVVKRYHVTLKEPFHVSRLARLVRGITVEGERLRVERAALVSARPDATSRELDVHMHHGKKREIRQLFSALGYGVSRLRRYQIGSIRLRGIPLRGARQLASKETEMLFKSPRTPSAPYQATAAAPNSHED